MKHARLATLTIWRTVVCAGAMLAIPACPRTSSAPEAPVEVRDEPVAVATPVATPVAAPAVDAGPAPMPEPVVEPAPPEPEPVPVVVPSRVAITVTSKPSGAQVYLGDESSSRGRTPLTLELETSSDSLVLRLAHQGYVTKSVTFTPDGERSVDVKLAKRKKADPRPRGSGSGTGSGPDPEQGSTGRGFVLS